MRGWASLQVAVTGTEALRERQVGARGRGTLEPRQTQEHPGVPRVPGRLRSGPLGERPRCPGPVSARPRPAAPTRPSSGPGAGDAGLCHPRRRARSGASLHPRRGDARHRLLSHWSNRLLPTEPQPARLAAHAPRCVRGPVQQRARQGRWRRKVTQTPRESGPQGRAPRVPGSPCGRDRWPALPGGQASGWRTSSRPMAQSSVTGPAQGPTGLLRPFQQADLHGPPGAVLPSPACAAEQLDPRRSPWGGDSWAGVERKSRPREPVP